MAQVVPLDQQPFETLRLSEDDEELALIRRAVNILWTLPLRLAQQTNPVGL